MRRLELDFQRARRPSRLIQVALLALALAFAGDVVRVYVNTRSGVESLRARLERAPHSPAAESPLVKVVALPVSDEEYAAARDTIRKLSIPWADLFAALEAARLDSTTITAVEPDPSDMTVAIRGNAKDYLAAISLVANLRGQPTLRRVTLVHHEPSTGDPGMPVQFVISASWGRSR
ncbi:MAG: PilN domain-containing protein [Gemmatimonadaceae bacterium]